MHLFSRKTLLNLTALGLGMASGLPLLEGLPRWFIPDPDLATENRLELYAPDPQVGFRNHDNCRGWAHGVIDVRTNSMGLRGPEVQIQKSAGTKRILGPGDSVAFGTGVREPVVYLRQLERNANAGGGRGQRVEVVNLSVIGWSLRQELLALKRFGLPLSPDIVLVDSDTGHQVFPPLSGLSPVPPRLANQIARNRFHECAVTEI